MGIEREVSDYNFIQVNNDIVSLYYDDKYSSVKGVQYHNIYIKVKNLDYSKNVLIHYSFDSFNWNDVEAKYVKSLDDESDVFKAEVCGSGSLEYYIIYTAKETKFVDDNHGRNYKGEILGVAPLCAVRSHDSSVIRAATNKYGKNREVNMRYTLDNWQTFKDIPLKVDPNNDENSNIEYWSVQINVNENNDFFKFALCYKSDGYVYWDNNWGNNYDMSFRPN